MTEEATVRSLPPTPRARAMRPRRLRTWEEVTGVLRDVKMENGRLLLVFEIVIAISNFNNNLLTTLKKLTGSEIAILKTDTGAYRIRKVVK